MAVEVTSSAQLAGSSAGCSPCSLLPLSLSLSCSFSFLSPFRGGLPGLPACLPACRVAQPTTYRVCLPPRWTSSGIPFCLAPLARPAVCVCEATPTPFCICPALTWPAIRKLPCEYSAARRVVEAGTPFTAHALAGARTANAPLSASAPVCIAPHLLPQEHPGATHVQRQMDEGKGGRKGRWALGRAASKPQLS